MNRYVIAWTVYNDYMQKCDYIYELVDIIICLTNPKVFRFLKDKTWSSFSSIYWLRAS